MRVDTNYPILCKFCGNRPKVVPIRVYYNCARREVGIHQMYRVHCACGAIGKCQPSEREAISAWNEPWQAFVYKQQSPPTNWYLIWTALAIAVLLAYIFIPAIVRALFG